MRKLYTLSLLLMFACASLWAQEGCYEHCSRQKRSNTINKTLLTEAQSDNSGYDIKKYKLEINSNPDIFDFSGRTTIYFTANQTLSEIRLNAGDALAVDNITYHNQVVTNFVKRNDTLFIYLPTSIAGTNTDSISISFSGAAYNLNDGYIVNRNIPVAYNKSEPFYSRNWWVCKDNLIDKADEIEIHLTHPTKYKGVSNGLLISETNNGNGTTTSFWNHKYPIPPYLVGIAVSNYETSHNSVTVEGKTIPILNFIYPQTNSAEVRAEMDKVPEYISFLSEKFGLYPYADEKYGHAQWSWGGGMEHSTISFMVTFMNKDLTIHELMHQWFGDKVTCASWRDIWLNEGFATHSEALLREKLQGKEAYIAWKKNTIKEVMKKPDGSVYNPEPDNVVRTFDGRLTYLKAGMIVGLIRHRLGDEAYFAAMRDFLNNPQYAYGYASTEDLRESLETSTGKDFRGFFDSWIYGEGYPIFEVSVDQNANKVNIHFAQTTSHPSVSFFQTPIEVKFKSATGDSLVQRFELTQNNQHFELSNISFKINNVIVDPEFDLIQTTNKVLLNKINLLAEPPFRMYPNPVVDKLYIEAFEIVAEVQVFDFTGRLLLTERNIHHQTHTVDFSHLPSGSYLVRTQMQGGKVRHDKVLK